MWMWRWEGKRLKTSLVEAEKTAHAQNPRIIRYLHKIIMLTENVQPEKMSLTTKLKSMIPPFLELNQKCQVFKAGITKTEVW